MKMLPRFSALAAAAGALLAAGCYQVPVTGRRAVNLVNEGDVTKMSIAAFEDIKRSTPLSKDKERIAQLKRVGDRLQRTIPTWDMPDADWEFVVFASPDINAFAMAGGKVGVFEGLFKIIANDDQLASVIAHEIAHVTAKHVHEQLSQQMLIQTGGMVGQVALMGSGAGYLTESAIMSAYGLGTAAGSFAFDRKKEKEADYIGLMYMARAGYDPNESVAVLEKLEMETAGQGQGHSGPAWASTHPSNPERIAALTAAMPKALKAVEQSVIRPIPTVIK